VYLTDAGPARFRHDSPAFTVKRPAVQAGGIHINRGMSVIVSIDKRASQWVNHGEPIVNDAGPTPLILIEFKTPPNR
jgi:hypothetical protein